MWVFLTCLRIFTLRHPSHKIIVLPLFFIILWNKLELVSTFAFFLFIFFSNILIKINNMFDIFVLFHNLYTTKTKCWNQESTIDVFIIFCRSRILLFLIHYPKLISHSSFQLHFLILPYLISHIFLSIISFFTIFIFLFYFLSPLSLHLNSTFSHYFFFAFSFSAFLLNFLIQLFI